MRKNTGGQAFPMLGNVGYNSDWTTEDGMTLRDYFAAKALQGWLASYPADAVHPVAAGNTAHVAQMAYIMADAMLEARGAE